ncbi:MAG: SLC13 family permease [Alphaproteobacteria bacterium]|nr:SLC13 family permease [Alphaproteobacteria bacterium]
MTGEQIYVFAVLAATLGLFIWGRWRYDIVALLALLAVLLGGIIPAESAFVGFGHPAVITVAAVLVISRALQVSGVVGWIAKRLAEAELSPSLQVGAITALVAALSGFMNNVGALALLLPVVLQIAKKSGREPRELLMPLAFGSLLGGLTTLIGTPPNIIVAAVRADYADSAFGMFAFAPVGAAIAAVGVVFVSVIGWRLIPSHEGSGKSDTMFDIEDYITEVEIPEDSVLAGKTVREAYAAGIGDDIVFVSLIRGSRERLAPAWGALLHAGDHLLLEGHAQSIEESVKATKLKLVGNRDLHPDVLQTDTVGMMEAVVMAGSRLINRTAGQVRLATQRHINLIAIARHGEPVRRRLNQVRFAAGDVLLLQGNTDTMPEELADLGCLPLAERDLTLHRTPSLLPAGIFLVAILCSALGLVTVPIAFLAAVVLMILSGKVTLRGAYNAVDWPILVLLGAMVPVGLAMEASGASALIADGIAGSSAYLPPWAMLTVVLVATMMLSDAMNNAATAVLMAPLAAGIAQRLGVSPDPFLMSVAVGASCAFLTPIGHQSNVLVMGPGGYRFGDYWPMGLPLEILIAIVAVPMILWVWPL